MSERAKKRTPKNNKETNGYLFDVRDVLEPFKNAVCLKCGVKGKAVYIGTEDDGHSKKMGHMVCLECGSNSWDPNTVDRNGVFRRIGR